MNLLTKENVHSRVNLMQYEKYKPVKGSPADLLLRSTDLKKTAAELGTINLAKLSRLDIVYLLDLKRIKNKKELADILGSHMIRKLESDDIFHLLLNTSDVQYRKKALIDVFGQTNLNKLDGYQLSQLLDPPIYSQSIDLPAYAEMFGFLLLGKMNGDELFRVLKRPASYPMRDDRVDLLPIFNNNLNKLTDNQLAYILLLYTRNSVDSPFYPRVLYYYKSYVGEERMQKVKKMADDAITQHNKKTVDVDKSVQSESFSYRDYYDYL